MQKRRVIIELKTSDGLARNFEASFGDTSATLDNRLVPKLKHIHWDEQFPACALPKNFKITKEGLDTDEEKENLYDTSADFDFTMDLKKSTYLVRGEVNESDLEALEAECRQNRNVVNIFADVQIESQIICPGDPPLGTDTTVEKLLKVAEMKKCGMHGKGVRVAIVDTGVNMDYLNSQGKFPIFDAGNSWKPASSTITLGDAPVGHGTMCAFDVCIAAPHCTILDIALLTTQRSGSTIMEGFLSDAILAYRHLLNVIRRQTRPGENKSLVVNNSWGMFHPSWDYPVGHPGNYSDNPNHPFNLIVRTLERAGADILFAAGNCGKDCPDGRCQGVTSKAIYGANSSPYVTCVAGVDTSKKRVGYSAIGPGRLTTKKPDISGYTHFAGSGVYTADGGTSAACPVVAGVFAAVRTRRPFNPSNAISRPSAIRSLLFSAAEDLGPTGYDFKYGYGVVSTSAIMRKICRTKIHPLCIRYPWLCKYLCIKYPGLCVKIPGLVTETDATIDGSTGMTAEISVKDVIENLAQVEDVEAALIAGILLQEDTVKAVTSGTRPKKEGDCQCKE